MSMSKNCCGPQSHIPLDIPYEVEGWRVLPEDAKVSEKFKADMMLLEIGTFFNPDHGQFARGRIFNDSRGIFRDGDVVRTSTIKDRFELNGVKYIETRNTIYKLV